MSWNVIGHQKVDLHYIWIAMTTKMPQMVVLLVSAHSLTQSSVLTRYAFTYFHGDVHAGCARAHTHPDNASKTFALCRFRCRLRRGDFLSGSTRKRHNCLNGSSDSRRGGNKKWRSHRRERSKKHLTNAEQRGDMADEIVVSAYPCFYPFVPLW